MSSLTQPTTTQQLIWDLQWKQCETLQSIADKTGLKDKQIKLACAGVEKQKVFDALMGLWCRNDLGLDDKDFPWVQNHKEVVNYADKQGV